MIDIGIMKCFALIRLVNTSCTSITILVLLSRWGHHFHSNFRVCNRVWLIIITVLNMRFPELIHLITEGWCPFTNISPPTFSSPLSSQQPPFYSLSLWVLFIFYSTCKWDHAVSIRCSLPDLFHSANVLKVHPCCYKCRIFYILWLNNVHFSLIHSSVNGHFTLFTCLGYCE